MKKTLCILLAILMFSLPALAEENPFAPYQLSVPEGAALEESESYHTVVSGMTRVVVIRIDRVPDADPASAILRLMSHFDADAVIGEKITVAEGYTAVQALTEDKHGKGIDALTVMILSPEGDLLILSGYDMNGDGDALQTLMDTLLSSLIAEDILLVQKTR